MAATNQNATQRDTRARLTAAFCATNFFHVLKPTFLDICCPSFETFLEQVSWTNLLEQIS